MAKVIRFDRIGGPDVLRLEDSDVVEPGPGEVRLRHAAVGLNLPTPISATAPTRSRSPWHRRRGRRLVQAVGEGVTNVVPGDRVTYTGFTNTLGAYSTERLIPAAPLIRLPDEIAFETAAAMTMRGLTSAYLMRRIYPFKAGDTVLLHAAAGGVGLIVSQWAKLLGLTVIGTVSTERRPKSRAPMAATTPSTTAGKMSRSGARTDRWRGRERGVRQRGQDTFMARSIRSNAAA